MCFCERHTDTSLNEDEKNEGLLHRYSMKSIYTPFLIWLAEKCLQTNDTLITEVSTEFPKEQINKLFEKDFNKAYQRVLGDSMSFRQTDTGGVVSLNTPRLLYQTWLQFKDYDWVGYLSAAARRSGVPAHDQDSTVANIVVYLLVKPGKLFAGWDGTSPLEARWKLAVRNAVINARERRHNDQKRHAAVSFEEPGVVATTASTSPFPDEAIDRFKERVEERLGEPALLVLQHLLDGGEVKDLVKEKTLTSYRAKELVKGLKSELAKFAASDPGLALRIHKLLDKEQETLTRRFGKR